MPDYRPRVADAELSDLVQAVGAVLIEGPKACGKTATASRVAATVFTMDQDGTARASIELNPDYLFDRPTPILFDEWQVAPDLWNRVRHAVDAADRGRGLYLLAGSATPRDDVNRHSGAGRFGVLRMRPMSLFESSHSTGEVSVAALLAGQKQMGRDGGLTVPQLMERIVIGGWPDLLEADETSARRWLSGYLRQVVEVDIPSFVGRRDPRTMSRVLASLGRFVGQSPTTRAISADAGGERGPVAPATIYSHLDALERLQLLDNSEAWQPHMRSRTRLRTTATRYFVDPSLATSALGVSSTDLLNDLEAAGFHFEALVLRDLRIYAQRLEGRVDTWRDAEGHEVDAVITLPGGEWAAVEVKMSQKDVDKAAAALLRFADRVDTERQGKPMSLIVVTATGSAGRRPDGVNVVPITALGP
ncbi:ATP-binding protein [Luteimicrobium sp. DT211]|uniref:ATP-binding protein n=1 Tax=Luteimicrobium sp. DT211 TaxID=3393412 RepID=UPI003CEEFA03